MVYIKHPYKDTSIVIRPSNIAQHVIQVMIHIYCFRLVHHSNGLHPSVFETAQQIFEEPTTQSSGSETSLEFTSYLISRNSFLLILKCLQYGNRQLKYLRLMTLFFFFFTYFLLSFSRLFKLYVINAARSDWNMSYLRNTNRFGFTG